jgi:hypothetical protein
VKQSVKGINTDFVEAESDVFYTDLKIIVLAMFETWISVINISVLKIHTVFALCFRFNHTAKLYAILSSIYNMFLPYFRAKYCRQNEFSVSPAVSWQSFETFYHCILRSILAY